MIVQPVLFRQMHVTHLAAELSVGPVDVELLLGQAGIPQLLWGGGRDLGRAD